MPLILVLCIFFQTLRGASVPPHTNSSVATPSGFDVMVCECPVSSDDRDQQLRTVYAIVKSCLLTIFACVWQSAHPNINSATDSSWTRLKRKVITMFYVVVAPELVLYWALCQREAAIAIARVYNKEYARVGMRSVPPFHGLK